MAAIWKAPMSIMSYRIELAGSHREIATKHIQEAVDSAGMSGHVKII